jgi:putative alpha-1,2-mannosidase
VLGAPAFPKIIVTLPGGHPLVITAITPLGEAASRRFKTADTRYVQKLFFNGVEYDKNYLKLDDLRAGGTLAFEMSSTPNTTRGTSPNATPSSWGL